MVVVVPSVTASTAFGDQLDLRTAVVELVGDTAIVDVFPRLILLAEAAMNRVLKTRQRMRTATLTFVGGKAALPTDFWELIGVFDANGCEYLAQPAQATVQNTYYYSIEDGNVVAPLAQSGLTAHYFISIPTISDSLEASNWLLARYPAAYLYAVGFQAALQLRDTELAQVVKGLMDTELSELLADDNKSRYARARVRVGGCTP